MSVTRSGRQSHWRSFPLVGTQILPPSRHRHCHGCPVPPATHEIIVRTRREGKTKGKKLQIPGVRSSHTRVDRPAGRVLATAPLLQICYTSPAVSRSSMHLERRAASLYSLQACSEIDDAAAVLINSSRARASLSWSFPRGSLPAPWETETRLACLHKGKERAKEGRIHIHQRASMRAGVEWSRIVVVAGERCTLLQNRGPIILSLPRSVRPWKGPGHVQDKDKVPRSHARSYLVTARASPCSLACARFISSIAGTTHTQKVNKAASSCTWLLCKKEIGTQQEQII